MDGLISRFGHTHKIRSISVDTNVISDVIPYIQYSERRKPPSKEESRQYFKRCKESVHALAIGLSFRMRLLGTPTVRRELKRRPGLIGLYNNFFYDGTLRVDKNTRNLAKSYIDKINLSVADAYIIPELGSKEWNKCKDIAKQVLKEF